MVDLEEALDDCLARIAANLATAEECLAIYPEHADELRRLLAAARQLERGHAVRPGPNFKARNRTRLLVHMRETPRRARRSLFFQGGFRSAVGLAALALVLMAIGTGAAQAALPGDPLYGWKRASERAWRALAPDPLSADLTITRRRVDELKQVAGDAATEPIARQEYQDALAGLHQYEDPESRETIAASLTEQQGELTQAGLAVPELDQLITVMQSPAEPAPPPSPTSGTSESTPQPTAGESTVEATAETPLTTVTPEVAPSVTIDAALTLPAPASTLPVLIPTKRDITAIPTFLPSPPTLLP